MAMHHSPLSKVRSFVVICCLVLIIGIIAYAYLTDTNDTVISREEIESNLENNANRDLGYTYISSYLKKFGIGNINSYKLNTIENQLESDFYKSLPAEYDSAKEISKLYLEYFFDTVDPDDKTAVTDAVIHCLFATLDDPYAYYRNSEEYAAYLTSLEGDDSFVGIGIMVDANTLEVIMVYKDSGADQAGIRRGDFIWAVDGKSIEEVSQSELMDALKGEAGTTVDVTVKRKDEFIDLTVMRMALSTQSVTYEIDENNVGYIYVTQFLGNTQYQFMEAVDYCVNNKAVAIIIDMRYNPGGLVDAAVSMVDYLVPDAQDRMITSYTQGQEKHVYYTNDGHSVNLPIAVICNEGTASSGEIFTAAIRDFSDAGVIKGVIVGKNTYGKGVLQANHTLYDISGITYTIGYYNPPCGVNFDGVGIAPDVEVEEIEGKDAPFDAAKAEVMKLVYSINGTAGIYAPAA